MPSVGAIRAARAFVELFVDNSKLVRGLRLAERQVKDFGKNVRSMGLKLTAIGSAIAAPMVAGVKVFTDFEQAMANVSTMLDEPEKHMDRFSAGVRALAVEFGESTDTLAKGLYDILSASVAPSKALDVLTVSVKAAKAGLTDTGVAADAITTILNAYGLSASEAGRVSDVLFQVVKRGKTTFGQLAPSIGMVISTAASAGVSLDEVGAVLATLTRNGVQTDNAITALNSIIMQFLKPSNEAVATAKQLGFEMSSATIQAEGLAGVFGRIASLPPDAIAKLFPDARALRGVIPALQNMAGFADDIRLMATSAGATDAAYRKMSGTLAHSIEQIKAAMKDALIGIGEALSGPLKDLGERIKAWGTWIRNLIEQNGDLIRQIAAVTAIVLGLGAALVVVGTVVSSAATVVGALASAVSMAATIFGGLVTVIGAILTPVGLVITAVAALGAYIVYATGAAGKALTWLGDQFSWLAQDAKSTWKGMGDALAAGDIALAAKILWLGLKLEWTRGVSFLKEIWADLKYYTLTVINGAIDGALAAWEIGIHTIGDAFHWVVGVLHKVWNGFVHGFRKSWDSATSWLAKRMLDAYGLVGGMSDQEVAEAKAGLDKKHQAYIQELDKERAVDDKAWNDRQAQREKDHKDALAKIGEESEATQDVLKKNRDDSIKTAEDELRAANDALAAAAKTAQEKRKAKESATGPGEFQAPEEVLRKAAPSQQLAAQVDKLTSQGTFNVASLLGLQAGDAADRAAAAAEKTAENTGKLIGLLDEALQFP